MAEFVMKDLVKKAGLEEEFYIESAATSTEKLGNPVHHGTRNILRQHGISCEGKYARQMTRSDYKEFDMLIAMDQWNLRNMERFTGGDPDGKVSLLMDYTDHPGEVADPWYSGNFQETWDDIREGCSCLLEELRS